jgi:surface carbohydrate biosynthesis protein (TIGR04326 family)
MAEYGLESVANTGHTLLVWDAEGLPPTGDWTTVLWNGFEKDNDPSTISIPTLAEEQSDILRRRYLAWIYELGETDIIGKRLIDHLELRPGFSYWWMMSMAQKFNALGIPQIDNAINIQYVNSFAQ